MDLRELEKDAGGAVLAKEDQAIFGFLIIQPGEIGFVFSGYVKSRRFRDGIKIIQTTLLNDAIDGMAAVAAKGFVVINNGVGKAGLTAMVTGTTCVDLGFFHARGSRYNLLHDAKVLI